jgi:hypothetical protein
MEGDDGDGQGEEEGVEGGEQRSTKDVTGTALRWPKHCMQALRLPASDFSAIRRCVGRVGI